jgi:hypothetical protein
MRLLNILTESLKFVDLPELVKKFRVRFHIPLQNCAKRMTLNGMEVKFSQEILKENDLDVHDVAKFFAANGWYDCSLVDDEGNYTTDEVIFRQGREEVDNVKPYYELELFKNKEYMATFNKFLGKLDFTKFYHISSATPDELIKTGGLRCKRKSKSVNYPPRIYMINGKMALKVLILRGDIDIDTSVRMAQHKLNDEMYNLAQSMFNQIVIEWEKDHDEEMPQMHMYRIDLPENWPVHKDPEFDDDDELSSCACFTNQNIPMKFITCIEALS